MKRRDGARAGATRHAAGLYARLAARRHRLFCARGTPFAHCRDRRFAGRT
ncbi:hypothetical protein BURPS1106B_A1391 [Burkholderia pseudomallei 1106b]|uniref:Uncharacterized protein n=2 Tax=Burkholderia pseudomallei TaxID=28450 RepID=A0A0E1WFZ8_BURPE|nr:hypothetical protein BURPS1106A_2156 [Burkholderia pseudomallei 1106a]EEH26595.1 conserved hypothetical protein [Burkholderia pseudomallei Pakistan 9]EES24450.1 hypothetical protein BURPS1106B_A1391 [Burkholderia pseudomallei 1106b]EET08522.1 hypothetical protein BURPS1710A_2652 [Burkholderia pseudomallei 1710a]